MKKTLTLLAALTLSSMAFAAPASFTADAAGSKLEFTGKQAGADFKGTFHKFTATVDFAADSLASSKIDVQIDMTSVDTKDKDRDTTLKGSDLFDVAKNPSAHYLTKLISKGANGYSATGSLTLRGVTKDVPIEFQFTPAAGGAKLEGTATLKRLDFGVGQGDWKATDQVGDVVKVNFSLTLKQKG